MSKAEISARAWDRLFVAEYNRLIYTSRASWLGRAASLADAAILVLSFAATVAFAELWFAGAAPVLGASVALIAATSRGFQLSRRAAACERDAEEWMRLSCRWQDLHTGINITEDLTESEREAADFERRALDQDHARAMERNVAWAPWKITADRFHDATCALLGVDPTSAGVSAPAP